MAIDIIGSYRKWSLLTAPPIILGGIVGTVIVCDFLFRKTGPDEAVTKCTTCGTDFSAFVRKHHCRNCGDTFCDKCTHGRIALTTDENAPQVRVCDRCMAEVTHRLSNTKEADSRSAALKSHEDLEKKLQDIDVCYAFVEFEDIAGVQNAIKIKKHGKQADILVQLDALGLKIIQVTADGNCFFRALADQLEGNEDEHMKYRINGNATGSPVVVSNMSKRVVQASRFMLQMLQAPLYARVTEQSDETCSNNSPETTDNSNDFENQEEGLAIRIAAEVV